MAAVGVVAVAVVTAGLPPSPLNSVLPPNPRPSGGFAASFAASVVVVVVAPGAVVVVPVVPAAGPVLAFPSPKPVPGLMVGLAPPKSPPKAGAVAEVLAGADVVVAAVSGFGAKRLGPVVPAAVVDVGVDPAPIEGAAAVPVPVAVAPGGFKLPKRFDPLAVPVLGAAVVGLVSNRPPDGADIVGAVVVGRGHKLSKRTHKCTGL